ncbi:hypothetical protein LMG32289_06178 [Cupriavidus pampae]|uniref:Transposase n=1 Tax=Cupriavidus pampae TaxID=659251 RepID=A0ABM8XZS1_9BURK|nr:hypothetical protein LMG32289_06178 [Cupriavidus pampae]
MATLLNQQFKAFVGIDWADTKHDVCLQPAGVDRREFDCIAHQVARIDEPPRVSWRPRGLSQADMACCSSWQ